MYTVHNKERGYTFQINQQGKMMYSNLLHISTIDTPIEILAVLIIETISQQESRIVLSV